MRRSPASRSRERVCDREQALTPLRKIRLLAVFVGCGCHSHALQMPELALCRIGIIVSGRCFVLIDAINLRERFPLAGRTDELDELAKALNNMQRSFVPQKTVT